MASINWKSEPKYRRFRMDGAPSNIWMHLDDHAPYFYLRTRGKKARKIGIYDTASLVFDGWWKLYKNDSLSDRMDVLQILVDKGHDEDDRKRYMSSRREWKWASSTEKIRKNKQYFLDEWGSFAALAKYKLDLLAKTGDDDMKEMEENECDEDETDMSSEEYDNAVDTSDEEDDQQKG